ncbi:tRNA (cytosine(32)/uridine(32)-2'-O)-methyltransferase TrmJ [Endothiovibrio diazotrophicus]
MSSNIRVVLVETSHSGNIGAAARAMRTMGLHELVLVSPRCFPAEEATAMASGADDVLAAARVCGTLAEALEGCTLVLGASARPRSLHWPVVDGREAGRLAVAEEGQAALVFGRERSGLTNEELELCHQLVHLPADPEYSSLNVAAAVQVLAYEVRMAGLERSPAEVRAVKEAPAPAEEVERYFEHLERVLTLTGFHDPANPRQLLRRLRLLYARARPTPNEINILRGFLTSIEQHQYWPSSKDEGQGLAKE